MNGREEAARAECQVTAAFQGPRRTPVIPWYREFKSPLGHRFTYIPDSGLASTSTRLAAK